jgi:uncharacterized protein (TIGR02145 family)
MKKSSLLVFFAFTYTKLVLAQTIMNIHQNNGVVIQIPINNIDSITYTNPTPGNLATITTTTISSISSTGAFSGGNITNDGGSPITHRGVCWSTSTNPTTADFTTNDGTGIGGYTSSLSNLNPNTTYYVRAFAINSAGTSYGNEISFNTINLIVSNPGGGVIFDGYTYSSIVLGNGQEWMAENLRTTKYQNGDLIQNVIDPGQWSLLTTGGPSTGAWAYYNNNSQLENPYGKLYNWYAVTDSRKICPNGWHVPSDNEWTILINYLGGENVAGGKLKATSTQYWMSPNTAATNSINFSALPGGLRAPGQGDFYSIGSQGYFWSSTETNSAYASSKFLQNNSGIFTNQTLTSKNYGYSVRCLKD